MSEYLEMTQQEQIALVEEFAHDVLVQYGMKAKSIECVNHAYNTTFKILADDGKTYAMRVSTNFRKWPEHIWAESQWLLELSKGGVIKAPVPILNLQGEPYSNQYFFYQGSNLDVIVYPWLDGEVNEDEPSDEQLFALGQVMAKMHQLSKGWEPEGYANFLDVDRPLMVRRDNLFSFEQPLISPEIYKLLFELRDRSGKLFDSLKERFDRQLIHADLHFGNILWSKEGAMSVLDFDDAGIGSRLQDIAISLFYLREDREKEKHLLAGYASVAPIPEYQPEELELLVANRQLVLLNYLFETTTADDVALIPGYLEKTERRLKQFFETGEFSLLM
jgi:Ser/Thr protein kinase RdoA (MazF antagonist)